MTALKRMLKLPTGTPNAGLRAELGIWMMSTQILKKKLMFLFKLIHYPPHNITRKLLYEQTNMSSPTWLNNLQEQCAELNININMKEIEEMRREVWERYVKTQLQQVEDLTLDESRTSSKKYGKMKGQVKMKDYCRKLNKNEAMTILKARLGMTQIYI